MAFLISYWDRTGMDWMAMKAFLLEQDTYMFGFGYRIDLEGSRYG